MNYVIREIADSNRRFYEAEEWDDEAMIRKAVSNYFDETFSEEHSYEVCIVVIRSGVTSGDGVRAMVRMDFYEPEE